MKLKICNEGEVHFPGGSIADTETLCGFGSRSTKDTKRRRITCAACLEIITNVRRYTAPTPEQPAAPSDAELLDWLESQKIVNLSKIAFEEKWQVATVQSDKFDDEQQYEGDLRTAIRAAITAAEQPAAERGGE
jgi:hypothetical protein